MPVSVGQRCFNNLVFKKGSLKAETSSVHRLRMCCLYYVNVNLFMLKCKGNIKRLVRIRRKELKRAKLHQEISKFLNSSLKSEPCARGYFHVNEAHRFI